jgi:uncharacterized protein
MPDALTALTYDYVTDILERRGPHREAHLALLAQWNADGWIVMAGATGDPVSGALIVFRDGADIDAYVAADPYVAAGLVTAHRTIPWTVVVP